MSFAEHNELENVLFCLSDRFGPAPQPLINLINESRLRLRAASSGIKSIVRRGCGVVCSVVNGVEDVVLTTILDVVSTFFVRAHIQFHVLPSKNDILFLCLHLQDDEDSYSLILRFIDKFSALQKTK